MIRRFRHRGLKRLYDHDEASRVQAAHAPRLRRILTALDHAERPADMDVPGWKLHPLKGNRKGEWSVWATGNWRVTWRFDGADVTDVNYEDYHGR